ncbi:MAG: M14 family zinc carboxypeptidase, partial [Gemmatimonadota bacterium]|nr:M14 family zinc carboxypeptidase [Gemmatimonadota bacterium]
MTDARPLVALLIVALAATDTALAQNPCCELAGRDAADRFRVAAITDRRFTHAELWAALAPYFDGSDVSVTTVGHSLQGRALRAVTFGSGSVRVLLWSQMHGDESTATMALADVIRFFAEGGSDPLRSLIADRLTVTMIPMLNPDGAERFQRHNAAGVDINRDARRLATPEAVALKAVRDSLEPAFGFNLHDQGARTTAGPDGLQVAIALLAPAADSARTYGPVRSRARQLAAHLAAGLHQLVPGRVAKYDDTFTPRAFGDLIQQWGTSTVLIESGALPDDSEKQELRWLNVALLLSALEVIATESYAEADPETYEQLPVNRRVANDL